MKAAVEKGGDYIDAAPCTMIDNHNGLTNGAVVTLMIFAESCDGWAHAGMVIYQTWR